jgi:hypothetical protein
MDVSPCHSVKLRMGWLGASRPRDRFIEDVCRCFDVMTFDMVTLNRGWPRRSFSVNYIHNVSISTAYRWSAG